jgi:hypothetical protein
MLYVVKLPIETKGAKSVLVPLDRLLLKKSPGFLGLSPRHCGKSVQFRRARSSERCSPRFCSAKDLREFTDRCDEM